MALVALLAPTGCQEQPAQGPSGGPTTAPSFQPAPVSPRILLGWQYRNAISELLGNEAAQAVQPPPDTALNGFDGIGASQLALSSSAIARYESSAWLAAQAALANTSARGALLGCTPRSTMDEECLRGFLSRFGARAWRRPLTDAELTSWTALGMSAAAAAGDFYSGVEVLIAGLLQSPHFLYMVEVGVPDPSQPGRLALTGHEMATRLAFFLAGTSPDETLLAAAARGELDTAEGVRTQARRLLALPTARTALAHFFDELLQLRELSTLSKDATTFPFFTPSLAASMREETQRLLEDIVWEREGDFRDAFDSGYTFVDKQLAALYGISGAPATGFARVTLPAEEGRGGLLGHASFLSLLAHTTTTSPTLRGRFIRERLLCEPIAAPPTNIPPLPAQNPGEPPRTMRQRLQQHVSNPSCAGCHDKMDPLGLGLENFDAVGRYRTNDNDAPIDPVSTFDRSGTFSGPRQLGGLLRADDRVLRCLVRNLFRMASGHVDEAGEQVSLNQLDEAFATSGYRMKELLVELVASDAFRYARSQEVQP
ncbi:DUF1592 domain-containing protein [Archangium violaceum]|uniref:DUF1592 domain-containing protein n=1 Tax=Archangium violaceum TaxID=83451 RepID=UPI00193B67C3|nr:DUF1592 domain-containing protein [Archangium violaceum]QRK06843.1 DUF1592 domain-containing protein [Archangium violaceum]